MGWTHLRDETPRARKAYRCIICGEVIEAGLKHTYLWQSINGKKSGARWSDNPWVWVIEFKVVAS